MYDFLNGAEIKFLEKKIHFEELGPKCNFPKLHFFRNLETQQGAA